ncbi:MAG: aconitate hydratase, partial [Clostridia bacterium]|nr:aconitate hydratase [Clostridia bacterium]
EIRPDDDAQYVQTVAIDLSTLRPLAAMPHMPDNVKSVSEIGAIPVDQVLIGSCTNSSFADMMKVAAILKGKKVNPRVSLGIAPGSKQVLTMLALNGALSAMIDAGARILESACGPCIGMGQSPCTNGVSLRTFNRNFEGRSGTPSGKIYLVSPETAAVSAITGVLTDPTGCDADIQIAMPAHFLVNDNMIELPAATREEADAVEVCYGPNIKPYPATAPLADSIAAPALLKVGDNITTDHIMPAGAKILPYRSNIPKLSEFCFRQCDENFAARCKEAGSCMIIGGENYGQGSSREHAALVPLYLGVKAVIAKSFARIHKANLVNAGILPLTFVNPADYDAVSVGDELELPQITADLENGGNVTLLDKTTGATIALNCDISERQLAILKAGGLLDFTKKENSK